VLACLGLVARLVLAARQGGALQFEDERDYHRIAQHLLAGHGFVGAWGPTAFRPPGQPLWLSAVYAVVGVDARSAAIAQAVLASTLPFAMARLARLISRRPSVSIGAAAVAALHPGLVYASATLYPVVLTTVTLGWGLTLVVGAGLLGVAALATPYFAPMPVVAALLALRASAERPARRLPAVALAALVGLAPCAAWTARNARVLGAWTLGTSGGFNLALGANDAATPRSGNWIAPPALAAEDDRDEVVRDRAYRVQAARWISTHKTRWAALVGARAIAIFDSVGRPRTRGAHDGWPARLVGLALLPLAVGGVFGVVVYRRSNAALLTGAAFACVLVAAAPTIVKPRFRFPVDPALGTFAVAMGAAAVRKIRRAVRPRDARAKEVVRCPA
jgi:hypothetical protein